MSKSGNFKTFIQCNLYSKKLVVFIPQSEKKIYQTTDIFYSKLMHFENNLLDSASNVRKNVKDTLVFPKQ